MTTSPIPIRPERVSLEFCRERYPALEQANWLLDFIEEATLFEGDLTTDVAGILELHPPDAEDDEGSLIIVDGNLTFSGDVDWGERGDNSNDLLLCTGDLKARSLHLVDVGVVLVGGSLEAAHILVHYGDNGGGLTVSGDLIAEVVIARTYFVVEVGGALKVRHVISDGSYAADFAEGREVINVHADAGRFVSEAVRGGKVDDFALLKLLQQGKPIFEVS